jgi:hypothetical protein
MTDQEMWYNAVAVARSEFEGLPAPVRANVRSIVERLQREKEEISSIPEKKGASGACSICGGRCCDRGKYHFSAIDLLVFLVTERELFDPSFGEASCPYMGTGGCLMEPSYRPFTCITFHCESLEGLLSPAEVERLYELERSLRSHCRKIEDIFGTRMTQGLLLSYGRYVEGKSSSILAGNF